MFEWFKKKAKKGPPTAGGVAMRLQVLKCVAAYSYVTPPREAVETLKSKCSASEAPAFEKKLAEMRNEFWNKARAAGLWEVMSAKECTFAETTCLTMTDRQRMNASWRIESVQILLWALNLIPEIPPYDQDCKPEILKKVPTGSVSAFAAGARLREADVLQKARDLAEFWHWRSRTRELIEDNTELKATPEMSAAGMNSFDDIVRISAKSAFEKRNLPQLINGDFPALGKAYRDLTSDEWSMVQSITLERHFALNWLCGYAPNNEWDETPTDT